MLLEVIAEGQDVIGGQDIEPVMAQRRHQVETQHLRMPRGVARRSQRHDVVLVPEPEPVTEWLMGRDHIDTSLLLPYPIRLSQLGGVLAGVSVAEVLPRLPLFVDRWRLVAPLVPVAVVVDGALAVGPGALWAVLAA
jgi:hypothetical protein